MKASVADGGDDVTAVQDRRGQNKELKDRREREEQRGRKAHQKRTGRFLEHDLPVQVWCSGEGVWVIPTGLLSRNRAKR